MTCKRTPFAELFFQQFGELPCGGFINATIEDETADDILFRCHYNNFDNEDDSWHYNFCKLTGNFTAA